MVHWRNKYPPLNHYLSLPAALRGHAGLKYNIWGGLPHSPQVRQGEGMHLSLDACQQLLPECDQGQRGHRGKTSFSLMPPLRCVPRMSTKRSSENNLVISSWGTHRSGTASAHSGIDKMPPRYIGNTQRQKLYSHTLKAAILLWLWNWLKNIQKNIRCQGFSLTFFEIKYIYCDS